MANHRNTHTNDTFTTINGKTVRFEDIFVAIDEEVTRYGFRGGQGMTREDLEDLRQDACKKARNQCIPEAGQGNADGGRGDNLRVLW